MDGVNNKLDIAKEIICELQYRLEKIVHNTAKGNKRLGN